MTTTIPSTRSVFTALLKADLTTQWRNRRASMLVILVPVIILVSWKNLVGALGGTIVMSNAITIGLNAIGLMGYTNAIAKDRDKGIFQRLRVAPASNWSIMASRLTVQLVMITILTLVVFLVGYKYDGISLSASGYLLGFIMSLIGGAVYLALGQVIVGLIKNPETVNATTRLVYFAFIMVGMFGQFGETSVLGDVIDKIVKYSPYGAVKRIVSSGLGTWVWNKDTSIAFIMTIAYTIVFTILGIKWFRWSTR